MISLWEEKDIPGFDPELSAYIPITISVIDFLQVVLKNF